MRLVEIKHLSKLTIKNEKFLHFLKSLGFLQSIISIILKDFKEVIYYNVWSFIMFGLGGGVTILNNLLQTKNYDFKLTKMVLILISFV